jgi:hypothetical protein
MGINKTYKSKEEWFYYYISCSNLHIPALIELENVVSKL